MLNKIKGWVKEHKEELILAGGVVVITGVSILGIRHQWKKIDAQMDLEDSPWNDITEEADKVEQLFDPGRDLDMVFQTKDGEVLGKMGCSESYMDDMFSMEGDDSITDYR